MKTEIYYIASDGTRFDGEQACRDYEKELNVKYKKVFEDNFKEINGTALDLEYMIMGYGDCSVFRFKASEKSTKCLNHFYSNIGYRFCSREESGSLVDGKTYYLFDASDNADQEVVDLEYLKKWFMEQMETIEKA